MRLHRMTAAAGVLTVAAAFCGAMTPAEAGNGLQLKRFVVGSMDYWGGRFHPVGGLGATGVYRDSVILLVFTAPVDFSTVNSRTVKIGIPTSPGLMLPAEGEFCRFAAYGFDPISGSFVQRRVYRNRFLFDPTSPDERAQMACVTPEGLRADTLYSVTVPGVDTGGMKVLETPSGHPNLATFTTTFQTSDRYMRDLGR